MFSARMRFKTILHSLVVMPLLFIVVAVMTHGTMDAQTELSGGSYLAQNEQTMHFGLGSATMVDRIEVRWPTGQKQEWKRVPAGKTVTLIEGQAHIAAQPYPRKTAGSASHRHD